MGRLGGGAVNAAKSFGADVARSGTAVGRRSSRQPARDVEPRRSGPDDGRQAPLELGERAGFMPCAHDARSSSKIAADRRRTSSPCALTRRRLLRASEGVRLARAVAEPLQRLDIDWFDNSVVK